MKHIFIGLVSLVGFVALAIASQAGGFAIFGWTIGYVWLGIGMVHYRVQSFAIMARNKTLDGVITFDARPRTSEIVIKYIVGGLFVSIFSLVLFAPVFLVIFLLVNTGESSLPIFGISTMILVVLNYF